MKFKFLAGTWAMVSKLFGVTDLPLNAEGTEVEFTAEQRTALEGEVGKDLAKDIEDSFKKEFKEMGQSDQRIKAIQDEIAALLAASGSGEGEPPASAKGDGDDGNDELHKLQAISKEMAKLQATVKLLMDAPEGNTPAAVYKFTKGAMEHSKTHLFGQGLEYNAFEGRPWNQRLRDGGVKATDFNTDSAIPTLQGDMDHFFRENPKVINSLFNDFEDLPAEWDRRTGVSDQIADGFIVPAEIVQGRRDGWQPKNKFKFDSEIGKVYAKKIDITFNGQQLQKIENTWVAQTQKMDGSHPWKMSFIGFLLIELIKQQKVDDRIAQINGIYANNPDETVAGDNVNSQNGVRYLWYYYRDILKKYKAFNIGTPTDAGIVDYVRKMIESLPEDIRKMQGLELQISDRWMRSYATKAGEVYNLQRNTDQGKMAYDLTYPIDYPNIKFQVLKDQTNTDFMGITFSKNIQVMEYDPSEKGKFTITHEKRDTHIFADYKIGIRFIYVGTKRASGEPLQFEKQMLWSNSVPVFGPDVKVPVFDNESGILNITYNNMVVDKKWVTDITELDGDYVAGQILRITGNASLSALKNLKNSATIALTGGVDYPLNTGGTITLFVNEDKTVKELTRTTTAPAVASTDVTFTTTTIDANLGGVFKYGGATATIVGIINGVEGQAIRVYGKTGATLTLSNVAGNIDVVSTAAIDADAEFVDLVKVDGIWRETKRSITA